MLTTILSSTCIFCIFLFVYNYQITSVHGSATIPPVTSNTIPRLIRVKNAQPCALYSKNNRDLKAKDIKEHISRKSRLSHHGHHDHNKIILKPSTQVAAGSKKVTVHHFKQKDSKATYLDWQKRHIGFESYAKRLNLTLVNGTEIVATDAKSATVRALKTTKPGNFITSNNTEDDNELGITSKNDISIFDSKNVDVLKRNQEVIPLNLAAAITIKPRNDNVETTLSLEQQCKIPNEQLQPQRSVINQHIHTGGVLSNLQAKPIKKVQPIQPVLIKNTPQRLEGDRQIMPGTQEWNERVQEAHVAQAVQDAERATMYSMNKYNRFTKLPQMSNRVSQVNGITNRIKSFPGIPADPNKLAPRTILTKVFIIPIQEEINDGNLQSVLKTANQVLDKNTKRSDLKNEIKFNSSQTHAYLRSPIKNQKHDTQNVTTPKQKFDKENKRKTSKSNQSGKVANDKKIAPTPKKEKRVSKKKSSEKIHNTKKKLRTSNKSKKHKKPAPKKKIPQGSEHKRKKYKKDKKTNKHKDKKPHKHPQKKKPHRKHKEEDAEDYNEER